MGRIEGGMDNEKAYNASDFYIRRYDKATSEEKMFEIHRDMIKYFTKSVAAVKKEDRKTPCCSVKNAIITAVKHKIIISF